MRLRCASAIAPSGGGESSTSAGGIAGNAGNAEDDEDEDEDQIEGFYETHMPMAVEDVGGGATEGNNRPWMEVSFSGLVFGK